MGREIGHCDFPSYEIEISRNSFVFCYSYMLHEYDTHECLNSYNFKSPLYCYNYYSLRSFW